MAAHINDIALVHRAMVDDFPLFFRITAPNRPYQFGRHTNKITEVLQEVSDDVIAGKFRYIIINTPPRHGKSDMVSRRFPPFHLNRAPDHEVLSVSYAASLAIDMSVDSRKCYRECLSKGIFKNAISRDSNRKDKWTIADRKGGMTAIGFDGSATGKGAHILNIDDYHKNRLEAESPGQRDTIWAAFQNDLMTRLSPEGHAVIITATRWGDDDLVARIEKEMKNNPDFPTFEKYNFPAFCTVTNKYLFEERFTPKQYATFKAIVGTYAWNALYQGDPQARDGNMLNPNNVQIKELDELPDNLRWRRGWDLASTKKQRVKDDPDFTSGACCAYSRENNTIYVRDVTYGQWTAPRRDAVIKAVAYRDRQFGCARVRIEGVAGYKDTVANLRKALAGKCTVQGVRPVGDKVTVVEIVLEPFFESCSVVFVRGPWNEPVLAQIGMFPNGAHDDHIDAIILALYNEIQEITNTVTHVEIGGI